MGRRRAGRPSGGPHMIITVTLNPAIDKTVEARNFAVGGHVPVSVKGSVPAGKGINVARGLAVLGSRVIACALVGRNEQVIYSDLLARDGIASHFVPVEGSTRTNTTIVDPDEHTTTHLREEGFRAGRQHVRQLRQVLAQLVRNHLGGMETVAVVFCGSLPPGVTPVDFCSLAARCRDMGALVGVDTSGEALKQCVRDKMPHFVKPNLEELGQCVGEEVTPADAPEKARQLLGSADRILLTLGADGAYFVSRKMVCGLRCPVPPDRVRNTVGAGDAFLAGWLSGWERTGEPKGALGWAVATGAAAVQAETAVGYTRERVESLRKSCEPI